MNTTTRKRIDQINGNNTWLKALAMIAMVFDHAAYGWCLHRDPTTPYYHLLRMPGRISIPIFSYLIAWNYLHNTTNPARYVKRLWIFAAICEPLYDIYFGYPGNAFLPLAAGATIIHMIATRDRNTVQNDNITLAIIAATVWGALAIHMPDIACQTILTTLIYIWLRTKNHAIAIPALIMTAGLNAPWMTNLAMIPVTTGLIAAAMLPALKLPRIHINKHIAYWFYPLHILALFGTFGPA